MSKSWSSNDAVFFFQVIQPAIYLGMIIFFLDMAKLTPRHRNSKNPV